MKPVSTGTTRLPSGTSTVWVLGEVPKNNRAYFGASVGEAASYRVQVLSFDWACNGGSGGSTLNLAALPEPVRNIVRAAYGDATGHIFLISAAIAVVGILAALLLKPVTLRSSLDLPDTARSVGEQVGEFASDMSREAGKQFGRAQDMAVDAYDEAHAAMRRHARASAGEPVVRVGALAIDLPARIVTVNGARVTLTPKEYRLLQLLAQHAGNVVTHQYLLKEVWGSPHLHDTHYLRIFVRKLRQKIEDDPTQPRILLTETGVGYRLRAPDDEPNLKLRAANDAKPVATETSP